MEYGLIGEKLGHSFSQIIHNRLSDYDYELKEIKPENIDDFMRVKNFKAINVTIPYKQTVISYLDEISDDAKNIGAVNTIVNKQGKLFGYNTDFLGLKKLIIYNKIEVKGKKVLILGSGGTSKTAQAVVRDLGAKQIFRVSRSDSEGLITYTEVLNSHTDAEILINTTPCGMYPDLGNSAIDISAFTKLEGVVDVIYNPLSTSLIIEAKKRKIKAVGGLFMLVAQAVFASELFLGTEYSSNMIEKVFKEIQGEKRNIVLIGMPGAGKTTIGKEIAVKTGKKFIDSDEEIVKKEGISIPEIFKLKGEKYFRCVESEVLHKLSSEQGAVIATGGGAVLNSKNIDLLKENGAVYFLDRNIADISATSDRPLSSNRLDLIQRYNERYPIYVSLCDYKIVCTNNIAENVKEVISCENFSY